MPRFAPTCRALAWFVILLAPVALAQSKPLPFTFTGTLSGDQMIPAVETDGSGAVIAVLTGNELVVTGSYRDLTSRVNTELSGGGHVRLAPPGETGPIVPLVAEQTAVGNDDRMRLKANATRSGTFSGVFTLSNDQLAELADGQFYVQLYTVGNITGELRGQLGPNDTYDAYRDALEDPEVIYDATAADLVGIWRTIDGEGLWQNYEDGTWTWLDSLTDVGRPGDPGDQWAFEESLFAINWGSGSQVEYTVLYEDGRRRYLVVEASGSYTEPGGIWHELLLIDEQGNRVNLRE